LFPALQRYEIVNGVVEVEDVTVHNTTEQEEEKASEGTTDLGITLCYLPLCYGMQPS